MKILLILLTAISLFGAQIHWVEGFENAKKISKKTDKPLYVFISAPECPWCEKFERTTLKEKEVINKLDKNFVCVHLVRGFDEIPEIFKDRPVPRHYVVFDKANYFYEDIGYFPKDIFLLLLNTTLKEMKK